MVCHVVLLECDAVREDNRPVGNHSAELVVRVVLEPKHVRQLMDGEEERVVGGGTNNIHCRKVVRPAPVLCPDRHENLQSNSPSDTVFGERLWAHQLLDLRVRLEDLSLAGSMRLGLIAVDEVGRPCAGLARALTASSSRHNLRPVHDCAPDPPQPTLRFG